MTLSEHTEDALRVLEEGMGCYQVGRGQQATLRCERVLGRTRQSQLHLGKVRWEWRVEGGEVGKGRAWDAEASSEAICCCPVEKG